MQRGKHLRHGKSGAGVHEFIENHCVPLKNEMERLSGPFKRAGLQSLLSPGHSPSEFENQSEKSGSTIK